MLLAPFSKSENPSTGPKKISHLWIFTHNWYPLSNLLALGPPQSQFSLRSIMAVWLRSFLSSKPSVRLNRNLRCARLWPFSCGRSVLQTLAPPQSQSSLRSIRAVGLRSFCPPNLRSATIAIFAALDCGRLAAVVSVLQTLGPPQSQSSLRSTMAILQHPIGLLQPTPSNRKIPTNTREFLLFTPLTSANALFLRQ